MADNVTADPGSGGAVFKTDEDTGASAHVPVTKIELGDDGDFDGYVSATNPMPVTVVSIAGSQTDDAAFTPGTSLVSMIGAEFDDSAPDSVNEGDGGAVRMSGNRNLYVTLRDAAGNERGLNVDASGRLSVTWSGTAPPIGAGTEAAALRVTLATDSTGSMAVRAGTAAHDAAVSGNPVRLAGRARSTDYTAVASDDTADLQCTLNGKLVVQPYAIPELTWSYAAASGGITNTTGVTARASAGAGLRNYIKSVQVINGHATVSTDVQIRDGAAGTVLWRGFAQAVGGGASVQFDPPLRGTAATLVEVACGTTGSATYFNLQGYSAP